jgi:hypothetical protein
VKHWYELPDLKKLKSHNNFQKEILLEMYDNAKESFYPKNSNRFGALQTEKIKYMLINLGLKKNFWVYANRLKDYQIEFDKQQEGKKNKVKNREWLFDLHWYKDSLEDYYTQVEFALAVECEWENKRLNDISGNGYSAVKYDFQKLVVTNSRLKLLVFRGRRNTHDFIKLNSYFDNAIRVYTNLSKGSMFLFICFMETKYYIVKKKRSNREILSTSCQRTMRAVFGGRHSTYMKIIKERQTYYKYILHGGCGALA